MNTNGILQILLFFGVLLAAVKPLGMYMTRVYTGRSLMGLDKILGPVERLIYRLCEVRENDEMGWKAYAASMLVFNLLGILAVYALQRLQLSLPLNPQGI
ncbi:MAG: potassium-transporting ATPase subunit KdpA, partial [Tepidisphaeraceae bacterium]